MSEFDDNPFADPFADPSIKQVTNPAAVSAASTIADYDPFSAAPAQNSVPQAAVNSTTPSHPVINNIPQAQQQFTSAEFQRRQEELERKAQELARREEELRISGSGARLDNWPPLPSFCPIGPCFYQDINVDIPLEFQRIVRLLYNLWMYYLLVLLANVLGGLAYYISFGGGQAFGLALLFVIIFSPLSYVCWFRPVYKAFRSDSSINFMLFFFIFFSQIFLSSLQAIGVASMGSVGWIGVGTAFRFGHVGLGVFLILVALLNSAQAVFCVFLLLWVHRIYRNTGASFAKAQSEFTSGVFRNEHVQNATANAMSAAAQSQFSAQTTGSNSAQTQNGAPQRF